MLPLFSSVSGKNLNKQQTVIPDDFSEQNLVVIVAFQRWHQTLVNQTIQLLEQHGHHTTHHIIELPIVHQMTKLRRMRLDALMRAAIRDKNTRARTITIYTNKDQFRTEFGIKDERDIHWFIVDHATKEILERGIGAMSEADITRCFAGSTY
jgi:hypothetical protein